MNLRLSTKEFQNSYIDCNDVSVKVECFEKTHEEPEEEIVSRKGEESKVHK